MDDIKAEICYGIRNAQKELDAKMVHPLQKVVVSCSTHRFRFEVRYFCGNRALMVIFVLGNTVPIARCGKDNAHSGYQHIDVYGREKIYLSKEDFSRVNYNPGSIALGLGNFDQTIEMIAIAYGNWQRDNPTMMVSGSAGTTYPF